MMHLWDHGGPFMHPLAIGAVQGLVLLALPLVLSGRFRPPGLFVAYVAGQLGLGAAGALQWLYLVGGVVLRVPAERHAGLWDTALGMAVVPLGFSLLSVLVAVPLVAVARVRGGRGLWLGPASLVLAAGSLAMLATTSQTLLFAGIVMALVAALGGQIAVWISLYRGAMDAARREGSPLGPALR